MRIGIVVDSACDLPPQYYAQHHLHILPITVRIDTDTLTDRRDPEATRHFVESGLGVRGHSAETEAFSVEQIRELFLGKLVVEYDFVFCLTITATRSPIHENALRASYAILNDYKQVRKAAGIASPFQMRVLDTKTLFAGQGVPTVETVRMIAAGEAPGAIRERIERIANNTFAYMLPRDLYYLRARAQKKGDRSVGLVSVALGSALDIKPVLRGYRGETGPVAKLRGFDAGCERLFEHVAERVRAGLLTPTVCVSYGGTLEELGRLPGYTALMQACSDRQVALYASMMSVTGMVNVGMGAVAVAFASEPYDARF